MDKKIGDRIKQARELSRDRHFSEALRVLDSLVSEYPDEQSPAYERAALIGRHQPPREGLLAATHYDQRFPNEFWGALLLAAAYIGLRNGKLALEQLDRASKQGALASDVKQMRIDALALVGRKEEALVLAREDDDLESLMARFKLEYPNTLSELDRHLDLQQKAGQTAENLAFMRSAWYANHKMLDEALQCLQLALLKNSSSVNLNDQMARLELMTGKRAAARKRIGEILKDNPGDLDLIRSYAGLSFITGHFVTGVRQILLLIKTGLAVDPKGESGRK